MANLDVIKDYFLRVVLEESDNFKTLPEEEKQKSLNKMSKLSEAKQRDLCKFFVEREKDTLPSRIFMRFVNKVSNSMTALGNVAVKDKAIISKYRDGRAQASESTI
ncbi:MAG: hypothetical protein PHP74_02625 [Candidatus Gracilibacteria bacterium]|nr:hypothetical protein [Candidatus Gracilibacteria bacterium]